MRKVVRVEEEEEKAETIIYITHSFLSNRPLDCHGRSVLLLSARLERLSFEM